MNTICANAEPVACMILMTVALFIFLGFIATCWGLKLYIQNKRKWLKHEQSDK